MTSAFDSYIALVEQTPTADTAPTLEERATDLDARVAAHAAIFDAMESLLGDDGLTEAHRPLIPVYQRWIKAARQLVAASREMRLAGRRIASIDRLGFAINSAKNVADDFDYTVELNERSKRGEPPGPSRPLDEVLEELRAKDQQRG